MKIKLNPIQYEDKMLEELSKAIEDNDTENQVKYKIGLETYKESLKDQIYLSKIKIRELSELNNTADDIIRNLNIIKWVLILILLLGILNIFK